MPLARQMSVTGVKSLPLCLQQCCFRVDVDEAVLLSSNAMLMEIDPALHLG